MITRMKLTDAVGDWVTAYPATSRVFERHKIDYCCGGGRPLEEACCEAEVDSQLVFAELADVVSRGSQGKDDVFASKSLTEMCDSIETTHHSLLRRELPRLTQLLEKVVSVHGEQHPWLNHVADSFQKLREELVPHMLKEEQILFPAIRTIERTQVVPNFPFGSVDNPIRMMEHEHEAAGHALKEIRSASSDLTLPEGGCNTFRALLDGLRELEDDLHQHIHKENNVLFPQASQLAAKLSGAPGQ